MSCHEYSYYDYRKSREGILLAVVIAESIIDADRKLEEKLGLKVERSPFIGCRIEFEHCHSFSCEKNSFTATSCKCGFVQRHILKWKSPAQLNKVRVDANQRIEPYRPDLIPANQSKLINLERLLVEMREYSASLVLDPEES